MGLLSIGLAGRLPVVQEAKPGATECFVAVVTLEVSGGGEEGTQGNPRQECWHVVSTTRSPYPKLKSGQLHHPRSL